MEIEFFISTFNINYSCFVKPRTSSNTNLFNPTQYFTEEIIRQLQKHILLGLEQMQVFEASCPIKYKGSQVGTERQYYFHFFLSNAFQQWSKNTNNLPGNTISQCLQLHVHYKQNKSSLSFITCFLLSDVLRLTSQTMTT